MSRRIGGDDARRHRALQRTADGVESGANAAPDRDSPASKRHVGGSLLPSSEPRILQPIACSWGTLQVRPLPDLDTHALFLTVGEGATLLATHSNGYSCHKLAEHIAAGDEQRARKQALYITECGGTARHLDHIANLTNGYPKQGDAAGGATELRDQS